MFGFDDMTHTITLVVIECPACGTPFAISRRLQESLQETGKSFYCPAGHAQSYKVSATQKLAEAEKKLKAAQQDAAFWRGEADSLVEQVDEKKRQLKTTRAELTKTKKRIAGGACPCCNRQFTDLQRHMATKHPEYKES